MTGAAIVLDTTVVVDLLRRRPRTEERFRQLAERGTTPHVCAVTAEEISAWLRPSERDAAGALLESLAEAPLGIAEGRMAGWWRTRYRTGRTLSQADALIAAAAAALGASIATGNPKDFPMEEIHVEHWPVSE